MLKLKEKMLHKPNTHVGFTPTVKPRQDELQGMDQNGSSFNESSFIRSRRQPPPVDHIRINAEKYYLDNGQVLLGSDWMVVTWWRWKTSKSNKNDQRQRKMLFNELLVESYISGAFENSKSLNFSFQWHAVVLSLRTEKLRVIQTFDAYGPEKMSVLSKVHVSQLFVLTEFFWPDWMPGQPFAQQTFVLMSCSSYLSSS